MWVYENIAGHYEGMSAVKQITFITLFVFLTAFIWKFCLGAHARTMLLKGIKPLENYPALCASLFVAAFLLPHVFYTFDVTDAGFHLSQGMVIFHHGLARADLSSYLFLTQYFSGAVLKLLQYFDIGLVGARLAWLVVFITPITIVVHILSQLFRPHWLLPIIGLAAAINRTVYSPVLDYESVPSFFAAIFVYFLYKTYGNKTSNIPTMASLGVGASLGLMVISRITAVLMLPLLFLSFFQNKWKEAALHGAGFVISITIFVILLYHSGSLERFLTFPQTTDLHSTSTIISILWSQMTDFAIIHALTLFLLTLFLILLADRITNPSNYTGLLLATIMLAVPVVYGGNPYQPYTLPILISGSVLLITTISMWRHLENRPYVMILASSAISIPLAIGMGSYSGLTKLVSGAWLMIPLSLVLLLVYSKLKNSVNLLILTALMTAVLIVSGARTFHRYPYGDYYNREAMTGVLTSPQIAGIHTTPERQESFDALLTAIRQYKPHNGSDLILAYNNIPMVFYASQTLPIFDHPWINAQSMTIVNDAAKRLCTSPKTTPDLIVRTKIETRSAWGKEENNLPIVDDMIQAKIKLDILDNATKKCHTELVWQNQHFQILKPRK